MVYRVGNIGCVLFHLHISFGYILLYQLFGLPLRVSAVDEEAPEYRSFSCFLRGGSTSLQ